MSRRDSVSMVAVVAPDMSHIPPASSASSGSSEAHGWPSVKALSSLWEQGREDANVAALEAVGGGAGLAASLGVDPMKGVDPTTLPARLEIYGSNVLPAMEPESWISLFLGALRDEVLIILMAVSGISIILGALKLDPEHGDLGWVDGFAVLIAVFLVASVTATNDYNKARQFIKLSDQAEKRRTAQVTRGGVLSAVPVAELCVGDVLKLEAGTAVPADAVLLACNSLKVNESSITGESDDVKKGLTRNFMLLSGTQVTAGTGVCLVTAVGVRSVAGSILKSATAEEEETPLQVKLGRLVRYIMFIGIAAAVGTLVAMMSVNAVSQKHAWAPWSVTSILYAVTVIVVAIPEGLPLAVTMSLAYSTLKMLKDNNLIRRLMACETMGCATDICSDKTGTLTQNRMTVTSLSVGGMLCEELPLTTEMPSSPQQSPTWATLPPGARALLRDVLAANSTAVIQDTAVATLAPKVLSSSGGAPVKRDVVGSKTEGAGLLLIEAMGFPFAVTRDACCVQMLKQYPFSSDRKMMTTLLRRSDGSVLQLTTGGSDVVLSRCSTSLAVTDFASQSNETVAGTALLSRLPRGSQLDTAGRAAITENTINHFASRALRTIGIALREWPSVESLPSDWEDSPQGMEAPAPTLSLLAVLGIKDPLRPDVKAAVADCQAAGIMVRMCTGDNPVTAAAIARECGILREGGLVMEGPAFRVLTPAQLDAALPTLAVLARSAPNDKDMLVRRINGNLPEGKDEWLKDHPECDWDTQRDTLLPGHKEEWRATRKHPNGNIFKGVVGVTGDGTNDAPALRAADVGLAMGIAGTDVAKGAASIIILDDSFASITKSVLWGRAVAANVQKFLQFQLTVNVVALVLTFVSACADTKPPLNPVMMLWVNLIMDTLGALALATEAPRKEAMAFPPVANSASLITPRMWRFISVHSALQLFIALGVVFAGKSLLLGNTEADQLRFLYDNGKFLSLSRSITSEGCCTPFNSTGLIPFSNTTTGDALRYTSNQLRYTDIDRYISTFIFNAFVFAQIFNEFNARELRDGLFAPFVGLAGNPSFLLVIAISAGLQAIFVEFGNVLFKTTGLIPLHWGYTIGLGALTLPVGALARMIPSYDRATDTAIHYRDWFYSKMSAKMAV